MISIIIIIIIIIIILALSPIHFQVTADNVMRSGFPESQPNQTTADSPSQPDSNLQPRWSGQVSGCTTD